MHKRRRLLQVSPPARSLDSLPAERGKGLGAALRVFVTFLSLYLPTFEFFPPLLNFTVVGCWLNDSLFFQIFVSLKPDLSIERLESCYSRRMESKPEPEPEPEPESEAQAQAPDNAEAGTLDASGFEVTADRLEQLMKSMEVLLTDVEQLRSHCSHQTTELMRAAVDLRKQQDELKESYADLSREMQEIMDSVDELFSTKSAFEAKEKQAQKLNRQL